MGNGKENGNYRDYKGFMGVIEGILGICWGCIRIMERNWKRLHYNGVYIGVRV